MQQFTVIVHVMPRKELLDPAGKATLQAIHQLDFLMVSDVRIGKRIQLTLQANDLQEAHQVATQITNTLLINPIIEVATVEVIAQS